MTLKNDADNFRTTARTDGGDESGRAAVERGVPKAAIDTPLLSNVLTQHMTATWGS